MSRNSLSLCASPQRTARAVPRQCPAQSQTVDFVVGADGVPTPDEIRRSAEPVSKQLQNPIDTPSKMPSTTRSPRSAFVHFRARSARNARHPEGVLAMAPISIKKPSAPVVDTVTQARKEALTSTNTTVVVAMVGEVLRRQGSCGQELVEQATAALARVSQADVDAAVRSISVTACRADVVRASEEAFEAAFADSNEERALFAKSALEALLSRDRVESTLFAARAFAKAKGGASAELSSDDVEALGTLDGELGRSLGRSLTGINAERRASLGDLDASERGHAVWFASLLDADDLLPALAGQKTSELSPAARDALASSRLPEKSSDEMNASALSRLAVKTLSAEEKSLLSARAQRSPALAHDLAEAERPYELEADSAEEPS